MLVSVIIPCFNVEQYILECIESVLNQTHKNIEIICIDNNSSDKTWLILNDLKSANPELVIDRELRPGANFARNKGLRISNGEWIQFLDADDLLLPHKIENQLNLLTNNTSVDFIAGASIIRKIDFKEEISHDIEPNRLIAPFINKCGNTCSNLWRKSSLLTVGGWNDDIKSSQETELMLRMVRIGGNYLIDKNPLTVIRERRIGQISQGNPISKWRQYIEIRLEYLEILRKNHEEEYGKSSSLLLDFLMVSVLILGKYDTKSALGYYEKYIKMHWHSAFRFGFGRIKVLLIKSFGLKFFLKLHALVRE